MGQPRRRRAITRAVLTASSLPLLLWGCTGLGLPPEIPVTIEGLVTRSGEPLPASGVQVFSVGMGGQILGSAPVGASGAYRLELIGRGVCSARIVAYLPGSPYSLESDPELIPNYRDVDCVGDVAGPNVELPRTSSTFDTATVVGTITSAGLPASVRVWLMAESMVEGLIEIATATTDSLGVYRVEGPVPEHLCNNLLLESQPQASIGLGVSGCSATLLDFSVGG